jgi:hypothetical protein
MLTKTSVLGAYASHDRYAELDIRSIFSILVVTCAKAGILKRISASPQKKDDDCRAYTHRDCPTIFDILSSLSGLGGRGNGVDSAESPDSPEKKFGEFGESGESALERQPFPTESQVRLAESEVSLGDTGTKPNQKRIRSEPPLIINGSK